MTAREDFFRKIDGSKILYTTLEFYNSGFGTLRYVTGQQTDKSFRLELDAPRNADTVVTFTAAPFQSPEPEIGEQGEVALETQIAGAGLEIEERLKSRVQTEVVQIVWRQHLSSETYPVYVLNFELKVAQVEELVTVLKAETINTSGLDVSERYTTDRFPALKRIL